MAVWNCYLTHLLSLVSSASALTLLSAVAADPELSTLKSVMAGMGTSSDKPDPQLEERFDSRFDGRNYTFFAPTNAAFAKIPASQLQALALPSNYELLLSIVRSHIAEGYFTQSAISNTTAPITAIEGFALSFQGTRINGQASITATDFKTDNGVFHKIDTVLNPYTSYFGLSSPTGQSPGPNINKPDANLEDLLIADRGLNLYRNITNIITPHQLLHYPYPYTQSQPLPLFLVPSDNAFAVLPRSSYSSFIAPSNNALSAFLLNAGRLDNIISSSIPASTSLLPKIKAANGTLALSGANELDILLRATGENKELMVGNARVERELCWADGCVWVIDRILDPLYGILGV
ncbi:Coatomer subunit beta' [Venturia nashicola]|uniref:Coatomer subunit beta n=1 Tax=Venturia nashicola TaxID=86259 RepID=A0A4Z1P9P5_9PEZI|nr:Coatomer subunit beta' [Venturia nashicola]TLD36338.1 Coatomer subunit beta' [Venturia nashicola]